MHATDPTLTYFWKVKRSFNRRLTGSPLPIDVELDRVPPAWHTHTFAPNLPSIRCTCKCTLIRVRGKAPLSSRTHEIRQVQSGYLEQKRLADDLPDGHAVRTVVAVIHAESRDWSIANLRGYDTKVESVPRVLVPSPRVSPFF